jgi:hypothetical protein
LVSDATASHPLVDRFDLSKGQVVQEFGYDDDVDLNLRDAIEEAVDADLEDEDYQGLVDAVLIWWRDEDGDLADALMDCLATLEPGGPILVLTPKTGRGGHVDPGEIEDAANTTGMRMMGSHTLEAWTMTRLAPRA